MNNSFFYYDNKQRLSRSLIIIVVTGLIFLPSCMHRKSSKPILNDSSRSHLYKQVTLLTDEVTDPDILREYEAHLFDIVPFWGAELKRGFKQGDELRGMQWILEYEIAADQTEVITWYDRQLEYLGWEKIRDAHSFYTLMFFRKPKKCCYITMNNIKNTQSIAVVIWVFEYNPEQ